MSGAEAIGLAASIVQLVDLGARLAVLVMNVYKGMQEAPGRAQKQVEELRLLINTANFIREHRSLFDSPFVHASVSAALFEARRLELILDRLTADHTKGFVAIRYWRIAVGSKEPQIHFQFERLKHAKTQLIFSLTIDQTSKLVSLQDSVDQVQTLLALDREEKRSKMAPTRNRSFELESSNRSEALPKMNKKEESKVAHYVKASNSNVTSSNRNEHYPLNVFVNKNQPKCSRDANGNLSSGAARQHVGDIHPRAESNGSAVPEMLRTTNLSRGMSNRNEARNKARQHIGDIGAPARAAIAVDYQRNDNIACDQSKQTIGDVHDSETAAKMMDTFYG